MRCIMVSCEAFAGIIYQCNAYHFPCDAWSRNSSRPHKILKYQKHIQHEMFTVASVCNGVVEVFGSIPRKSLDSKIWAVDGEVLLTTDCAGPGAMFGSCRWLLSDVNINTELISHNNVERSNQIPAIVDSGQYVLEYVFVNISADLSALGQGGEIWWN